MHIVASGNAGAARAARSDGDRGATLGSVQADELSDEDFFRLLSASGARALVIGRKALILLGAPVLTADYDLWVHIDDVEVLNAAFAERGLAANHAPDEARRRGRYVLENGERIDVMLARARTGSDGRVLSFDDAWSRKCTIAIAPGLVAHIPNIDDLITTKRWASRPKDVVDIQFLELLRERGEREGGGT